MIDRHEKIRRLRKKLAARPVPDPVDGTGGLEGVGGSDPRVVDPGLVDKLEGDPDAVTPIELGALEAIVNEDSPVVDIVNDTYGGVPWPFAHYAQPKIRKALERVIQSVGRLEVPGDPQRPYAGTAFVVGERLLMTNRHVAQLFATGLGNRELVFLPGRTSELDFVQEITPRDSVRVSVERVAMMHPFWDMALLEVDGFPAGRAHLALSVDDLPAGSEVAVIGYPAFSSANNVQLQMRMFRERFEVKRLLPGKLDTTRPVKSFGKTVDAVGHDSSTLGGNSGSCVIDVKTGRVIGLHFAGDYMVVNYAVPSWELARDSRVVDAGVKFATSVATASLPPWQDWWSQADAASPEAVSRPTSRVRAAADEGRVTTLHLDLPIDVRVSVGAPRDRSRTNGAGVATEVAALALEAPGPTVIPKLPQDDGPERKTALDAPRLAWRMKLGALGPTVGTVGVPAEDKPSVRWVQRAATQAGLIAINEVEVRAAWVLGAPGGSPELESLDDGAGERGLEVERIRDELAVHEAFLRRAAALDRASDGLEAVGAEAPDPGALTEELGARIREILGPGLGSEGRTEGVMSDLAGAVFGPKGRPGDVTDYAKLFRAIARPAISMTWQHDDMFAWLRVAGPNPSVIRRVTELEKRLKLTDERFSSAMGDPEDTVEQALDDHRLFACDYEVVGRVLKPGKYRGIAKYVTAPLALFAVPRVGPGRLRPVAIHCEGVTTKGAAFFPTDGQAWKLARQVVQIADANHHELVTHLARTHLYVEVILLATRRNLAPNHPVNRLLVPHFEGTVFINDNARGSLIDTDGAIDRIFGGTIQSSQALSAEGLKSYDFQQFMLPRHFEDAGTERITDYPYRDDAQLLWGTIREWVRGYVTHYYAVPGSLQADWELRAWNDQLRLTVAEGGIPGFPQITTVEQLVDALAWIVFIPSCGHAAANFPQKTDMSYAPAISGAGWRAGGGTAAGIAKGDRLAFMPPLELARQQLDVLALLGGVYHTPLGDYRSNASPYPAWFTDPVIIGELLPAFQARLRMAEQTILGRNASPGRWRPYTHLLPSLVPMSTNI